MQAIEKTELEVSVQTDFYFEIFITQEINHDLTIKEEKYICLELMKYH